jgi:sensor domain CHASE-containing protein
LRQELREQLEALRKELETEFGGAIQRLNEQVRKLDERVRALGG